MTTFWTCLELTAFLALLLTSAVFLVGGAVLGVEAAWKRWQRRKVMPKRERARLGWRQRKAWRELSGGLRVQQSRTAPKGEQR